MNIIAGQELKGVVICALVLCIYILIGAFKILFPYVMSLKDFKTSVIIVTDTHTYIDFQTGFYLMQPVCPGLEFDRSDYT